MKKVTLLIPCHNEEQTLPLLYPELTALIGNQPRYEWEILFIDDGSTDGTLPLVKRLHSEDSRVSFVALSRNFGKEQAMLAGFDYATGDCMVILDADLQDPPSLIPEMLAYWEQGYQDVYARRADRGEESWLRRKLTMAFYTILDHSTRFDVLRNVGDFRLLDRQCINALKRLREKERYTKGLYCWIGYRKKEILFRRGNRVAGTSKWSFWSLLNLAIEGITSFTIAPLRFATALGALVAILAFCLTLFYGIKTLIYGDEVRGFTTLIVVILFMGGVQLFTIGILGEYIGRIFNETKNRPTYIASEYNDEPVL